VHSGRGERPIGHRARDRRDWCLVGSTQRRLQSRQAFRTSLTDEQAHQLAAIGRQPIVATDADLAGRIAAERDFWILSCYRLDPLHARLPDGTDPADLLALGGPTALTEALTASQPLAERLLAERRANLPPADAVLEATRIVAARPSHYWKQGSSAINHNSACR